MDNKGVAVIFLRKPELTRYHADIISSDCCMLVMKLSGERPANISAGQNLLMTDSGGDFDVEITEVNNDRITVKKISEQREYFRVDDVLPVHMSKVDKTSYPGKSTVTRTFYPGTCEEESPDETISPQLWRLLSQINARLECILGELHMKREGFSDTERKHVNLSASGIRFIADEKIGPGEIVEIKIVLPTCPPVGILVYGGAVRTNKIGEDIYEVAVHFSDLEEGVRDVIIEYALDRQREIIRGRKRQSGKDAL